MGLGILSTAGSWAHQEPPFHPCVWSVARSAPNGGPGSLSCVWGMRRPLALSAAPSLSLNSPSLSPALCSAYRRCEAALPSPPSLLNYCQPLACLYCAAKRAAPQRQREREREDADGERVCRQSNIVRSEGREEGRKMNRCVVTTFSFWMWESMCW